jgi:K+-sensing histidine kinase KdpD
METRAHSSIGDDGLLAVVAHALLGSISVVTGVIDILDERWDELTEATRKELLARAGVQAEHISNSLKDLLRGLPEEVIDALDALRGEGHPPSGGSP